MAVLIGAGVEDWRPGNITAGVVAELFAAPGMQAPLNRDVVATEEMIEKPGHSILIATLLLILVAEFGDKTLLAVWLGATAA